MTGLIRLTQDRGERLETALSRIQKSKFFIKEMGKKIKLFKSSTVSEDGYVVNPEAKKQPGDNL